MTDLKALVPPVPFIDPPILRFPVMHNGTLTALIIESPHVGPKGWGLISLGKVMIAKITDEGLILPQTSGHTLLSILGEIEQTEGEEWDEDPLA